MEERNGEKIEDGEKGRDGKGGRGQEKGRDREKDGSQAEIRDKNGLTEEEFLASYRPGDFERPSVAADMVIFAVTDREEENYRKIPEKELRLLLIKRGGHPYLGSWALPGGFVRPGETADQAAMRELREETGLDQVYLEQLYTFSEPGRDPRTWVMSCSYMALIDGNCVKLQAGDDADQAAWFKISCRPAGEREGVGVWELTLSHRDIVLKTVLEKAEKDPFVRCRIADRGGLAFDHSQIIACGLERLRTKIRYTDAAFHLMPEYFTLTQLKQVYEVILGKQLPAAAFRRKMASMVEETRRYTENKGHRPSRLYRRREGES